MNVMLVDVERHKHEGFFVMIQWIDVDNGKMSNSRISMRGEESQSFKNMAMSMAKVVIDRKPDKIIFDTRGIGIGLKDSFMKLVNEGWLTFIVDEKGNVVYKGENE